jgi:hypothetical protein
MGAAGGILLGINLDQCQLINWDVGMFSLTVHIQNKKDKVIWACTTVYGPTTANLKSAF